jgi:hypothetical protein
LGIGFALSVIEDDALEVTDTIVRGTVDVLLGIIGGVVVGSAVPGVADELLGVLGIIRGRVALGIIGVIIGFGALCS